MHIASAPYAHSKTWTAGTISFEELVSWLDEPALTKECGGYLLGQLAGGRRSKSTVLARDAITLDADSARADLPDLVELLGYQAIAHTTYRSARELDTRFGRIPQRAENPLDGTGRFAVQSYLDHHRSLRVTYADGMAPMNKHQFTLRMLFRKINQLCHPDKTKKFGRKVVLALRECFDDAHKAYERRDHQQLELSFIRTCYLRDELDRLDASDVKRIQDQLEGLKLDRQGMMMHPLFLVLFNHRLEDFNMAASYFSEFLDAHVVKLNTVIAEMQAKNSSTTQENGAQ